MTAEDAEVALGCFGDVRLVVISSVDVYRAFASLWAGRATDAVPLDEQSPVRIEPSPDREHRRDGWDFDHSRYEKLDVERAYLERGATVLRLPFVYGEPDYQRREAFILSRVRADVQRIEIGAGNWLGSRGYVGDVAAGIRSALEARTAAGEVFNLCEWPCGSIRAWVEQILDSAGWTGDLATVPDPEVADDLELTTALPSTCWSARRRRSGCSAGVTAQRPREPGGRFAGISTIHRHDGPNHDPPRPARGRRRARRDRGRGVA